MAASLFSRLSAAGKVIPVGLEMYSVRDICDKDPIRAVRAVGEIGYKIVELYGPYFKWTDDFAKQMRGLLDDMGMRCNSTHNDNGNFKPENLQRAIDLNHILGSKYVVMASAGTTKTLDDWKAVGERLTRASETLKSAGLSAGFHNHDTEFIPLQGRRPIEVIAETTPADIMLQFDIGTCVKAGSDPIAWIRANPGRIRCMHCKEWSATAPAKGYRVPFGEGDSPWPGIFEAAETAGGIEWYLIEQEESFKPTSLESVAEDLAMWKRMHE
jgi:sugar phosphate isomerase/epimerase